MEMSAGPRLHRAWRRSSSARGTRSYAFGAALVFGFSDSAQALLSILGVDVPPQVLNSVPYIVTIIVVAGVVGRVRGPAAAGQPYDQG